MRQLIILLAAIAFSFGCQTRHPAYNDYDEGSEAHGAAYRADALNIRKEYPYRPNAHDWEFYYKHCARTGQSAHYSKTSYRCTDPY